MKLQTRSVHVSLAAPTEHYREGQQRPDIVSYLRLIGFLYENGCTLRSSIFGDATVKGPRAAQRTRGWRCMVQTLFRRSVGMLHCAVICSWGVLGLSCTSGIHNPGLRGKLSPRVHNRQYCMNITEHYGKKCASSQRLAYFSTR